MVVFIFRVAPNSTHHIVASMGLIILDSFQVIDSIHFDKLRILSALRVRFFESDLRSDADIHQDHRRHFPQRHDKRTLTMATYKYDTYLSQIKHDAFDIEHDPGTKAPHSGIYRCMGCGSEVASNQNQPLPPQNGHQHSAANGKIRWKLIVYADHQQK